MITRIKATNYRCFEKLDFEPDKQMNIFVGDNEAGKSTILEIINLAISGRVRGKWATDDISPYWFNESIVQNFFDARLIGSEPALPEIDLEVYFSTDTEGAERLRGIHNSRGEDCPGLRLRVVPDPEYAVELNAYFAENDVPDLLPTDLYAVDWHDFSGEKITRQPKGLGVASVNASTVSNSSGIDYKLRQMLRDFVEPKESAQIAVAHRRAKAELTTGILQKVNDRIKKDGKSFGVGLQMDQSSNSNWDVAVTPHIEQTPFSMLGQGRQSTTKIALAMHRSAEKTKFVLVEEPENHLSHTKLMELLEQVSDLAGDRQVFVTTHSPYVLNRLGLNKLRLMYNARVVPLMEDISKDTIKYFQKQSGFDTLRLAIATKAVVVEGPSDEMIFNRAFEETTGSSPRALGIDVIALGTRGKRALELAKSLNKKIAVLRDNDGKDPSHWRTDAGDLLEDGVREMFIGHDATYPTLEPQLTAVNDNEVLRTVLDIDKEESVLDYMSKNKTEAAWRIAESTTGIVWPGYIHEAIEFIHAG